jgi:hypothetical protein
VAQRGQRKPADIRQIPNPTSSNDFQWANSAGRHAYATFAGTSLEPRTSGT